MSGGAPGAARLYLEAVMDAPVLHVCGGGEAAVFSSPWPAREGINEDAATLISVDDDRSVLAVADGVGGGPAGAAASETALRELGRAVSSVRGGDLRGPILDGIERANRAVIALGAGAATTLALAEVTSTSVRPYHVGDSAILLVGQRGKIKLQTVAHSPVGYALESGLLDEHEAMHHDDRHLISNIVGSPEMHIQVGPALPFAARDTLLLASDGVFDNLHQEEIVNLVRKGCLEDVAHQLFATCQQRMAQPLEGQPSKPDDLTFILFHSSRRRGKSGAEHV